MKISFKFLAVLLLVAVLPFLGPLFFRAFISDSFTIKGNSMSPTYSTGEKVWVNKLIIGPRIYTSFDFDTPDLKCFRMPGVRKIRVGDVCVVNYPWGWEEFKIGFKINYVYCKRCVGCPGDSVTIENCHIYNSRTRDIQGQNMYDEMILRREPDSLLLEHQCLRAGHFAGKDSVWTIKNMGPVYVPSKGDHIELTAENARTYALVLEYETGVKPTVSDAGEVDFLEKEYTFKENYYFFVGDFVADSKDSRYIGYIPEDFIIGVVGGKKHNEK